jgi:hypothetical protein
LLGATADFLGEDATELALETFLVLALLDLADLAIDLVVFGADLEGFLCADFTIILLK